MDLKKITLRQNSLLGNRSTLMQKVPKNLSDNERNVSFGVGTATHGAAATGQTLEVGIPRGMLLRDMIVDTGGVRGRISSIKAEGEELHQGKKCPFSTWAPTNPNRPEYDLPVAGGTTMVITYDIDAAGTIDIGWNID